MDKIGLFIRELSFKISLGKDEAFTKLNTIAI